MLVSTICCIFCEPRQIHCFELHCVTIYFSGHDCSKELDEERLKCQMEMENLRRELNSGFEQEREVWAEERRGLEITVGELRERVESQAQVAELEEQLSVSQAR